MNTLEKITSIRSEYCTHPTQKFCDCDACRYERENLTKKQIERNRRARLNRQAHADAMRSLGLVKVRGNLGGSYWE